MVKKLVGITTTGRDLIELIGVILQPTSAGAALSALPDSPELLVCSYDWKCPLSLQVDTSELCPHNENRCVFEGCLDGHRRTLTNFCPTLLLLHHRPRPSAHSALWGHQASDQLLGGTAITRDVSIRTQVSASNFRSRCKVRFRG